MKAKFFASTAIAAIALAIMTTIAGCNTNNALASENAQLRQEAEAAAAYINLLESDIERMDEDYILDVACETDAYINYYDTAARRNK